MLLFFFVIIAILLVGTVLLTADNFNILICICMYFINHSYTSGGRVCGSLLASVVIFVVKYRI